MKKRIGPGPSSSQRGVALMYAVFGTFVVASMVSVMFAMASVSDRQSEVKEGTSRAQLLAEGAVAAPRRTSGSPSLRGVSRRPPGRSTSAASMWTSR